jgi:prepilin-type N-terminal cleavage/methylation domain-containing protein
MHNSSGFTIIELVTTLVIASIIITMAIYSFADQTPHRQLKDASQTLIGNLRLARQKAIADGSATTISFSVHTNKYLSPVVGEQTLPNHIRFGKLNRIKRNCMGEKIGQNPITFDNDKVTLEPKATFQPNGTITGMGTVYLTNMDETVAIIVNITGQVRQCWWSENGWR